ncbi:MAG TPA: hypothetical protein DEQ87_13930 [Algoriphagus sp.]|jgi:hypothetical protein|uniref:hypothetical protein n=1 Tax=unclassified Algoriphagus TaxID=2641541 RepID=UPI000C35FC04|nr:MULTISPECIES: hypothetical protein [unclassified Algoriphagus]MAL13525.1 hypothetical protein [Algoriphagus sp.]QYH38364.1 hypothetical protein GYM62_05935 [Algoriphagus sp. NBT04N3]HAD50459.1 hypothetical protein [Algoriphagus sp.]HAH36102.1 hypothetical protein [Algoriphagus sp.]HAZ26579.1 hypothetical protein [Algoriphagus sp.]|tara:strand:+ start:358 stop:780 length:423 start_codon:yes stop_codon:yes gene_type:complete
MNWDKLDKELTEIVEKRNQLAQMDYNHEDYDDLEEEIHDLEDDFNEDYETVLEKELEKIYSVLKSDTDILLPTAYIANKYKPLLPDANGIISYEVGGQEGVPIESDQFDRQDVRIVLVPNPARFVMLINGRQLKDLWRSR